MNASPATSTEGAPTAARGPKAAAAIALASLVVLLLAMTIQKIWGADTWWQLATGRWMVEHHAWPRTDVFSYSAAGYEWIELRWVFCLLLYAGWQAGGPALLIAGQVAIIGATWAVVVWPARKSLVSPLSAAVILLGLWAGLGRWVLRPELITYLLTAVYLVSLDRLARHGRSQEPIPRTAGWWLPLIQVLWVNSHSLFVMGPVLAWTFVAGDAVQRFVRRARGDGALSLIGWRLVAIAVAASVACLVNPYGIKGTLFPLTLWHEIQRGSILADAIGEFRSPLTMGLHFWTLDLYAAAGLAVVVFATFILNWRRLDVARALVFVAGVYLACTAQRNAGLLAVLGAWAGLANVNAWMGAGPRVRPWLRSAGLVAVAFVSLAGAWYVATDRYWMSIGAPRETGIGVARMNAADGVCRFLRESHAPGPLFNAIRDGGWLEWEAPDHPVFVDGRLEVYGEKFFEGFLSIGPATWNAAAMRWGFVTAVVPAERFESLVQFLAASKTWRLVYIDPRAYVFVRETPETAELIRTHEIDPKKPVDVPGASPGGNETARWKLAIGGRARPWYATGMASAYFELGAIDNAARWYDEALRESPGNSESLAILGAIERFRGDARGEELYRQLPQGSTWSRQSDHVLADLLLAAGKNAEAARVLERVLESDPEDKAARVELADQYFQLRDFARAAEQYHRALEGTMGPAADWKKFAYALDQTQDYLSASDAYRISLAADPNQADTCYLLGRSLARQHDTRGAVMAFRAALKIKPDYPEAQQGLDALLKAR